MNKKCFSLKSNPVRTKQMWSSSYYKRYKKYGINFNYFIQGYNIIYTNHVLPKEIRTQNTPDYQQKQSSSDYSVSERHTRLLNSIKYLTLQYLHEIILPKKHLVITKLKNSIYVTTKLKEGISQHKQNKCRYLVLDPDSGKTRILIR